VAYAIPLLRGERPPEGPAGAAAWHDHSRTLEDETLQPLHHTHGTAQDGARLAMMHAWVWSPNPDGMFAADNWAIPYIRLGLTPPPAANPSAAKALSFATGGRDYFELAIDVAARSTAVEKQRVAVAMDLAQADVHAIVNDLQGGALGDAHTQRLEAVWAALWSAVDDALGTEAQGRVARLPLR
jgi:hypothetical protein